jgi:protein phosphatase
MRVRFSARSDVGRRREVNQDSYGAKELPQATLLVVCDGMGGHAAGEVASRLGVDTIVATFSATAPPDSALRDSFVAANMQIYGDGHGSMGTTGVAALFLGGSLHVANVGDSRAYLVREGQIAQVSHDHSFVSDQVAAGLMTAEQARTSNVRNIITRALGYQPEVQVDIFTLPLRPGDTVLLSSDGMHGLIEDGEIAGIASMLPPDQAVQRLVDMANERGGHDNITVVIAQVDEVDPPPEGVVPPESAQASAPTAAAALDAPVERPLSRLGLLLAALTLAVLLAATGFLLANPPSVSAPTAVASPAPVASPVPATTSTPASATTAPPTPPQPRPAATPTR